MPVRVKICGLTTRETLLAATDAGAAYVGFNFFPKSPRYAAPDLVRALALDTPPGVAKVGLVVDIDNATLDALTEAVPLDMIQLHGSETPKRVAEVRARYGLPVMKALGIATEADLAKIGTYENVADQLLIDAKPPPDGVLPGGNGLTFDWRLVAGRRWARPWMLAGGLDASNVAEAVRLTGATQVDLSSGVETSPGVKDPELIRAFMAACP